MTYEATVEFKFDATYTPTYGSVNIDDDYIPEEHYLITAPAADLNAKQYFKLFEKFMLCVGMCPSSIRSGAMSLVFDDMVLEEDQRKICCEYDITMNEDLHEKFKEWKKLDASFEHHKENVVSEPKIKGDLIDSAIEELMYIAAGGQNMKEYTDSVLYIKDVLKKCKSEEAT